MQICISLIPGQRFAWELKYFGFGNLCYCVFLFIVAWNFFSFCACTFLHLIYFHGSIKFFSLTYMQFFWFLYLSFLLDFNIFMFIWDGLFIKRYFIKSLSCVSRTIKVLMLYVRWFIGIKISRTEFPTSSDSLLWWLFFVYWKIITWLELPCLGFLIYVCCFSPYLSLDL